MSKTTTTANFIENDFFLCQTFSKAISTNNFTEEKSIKIDSPPPPPVEIFLPKETKIEEKSVWNVGDLCLCPFSEDGLLYKATILKISSPICSVRFDDYGNEEDHLITELQKRNDEIEDEEEQDEQEEEEEEKEEEIVPMEIPPLPKFDSMDKNANLSSTLMSWYLAGYHTGYYQAIKQKNSS